MIDTELNIFIIINFVRLTFLGGIKMNEHDKCGVEFE